MFDIIDVHTNLRYPGERIADDASLWPTFESRLAVLREAGVRRAIACRNESVAGLSFDQLLLRNRRIADACRTSGGLLFPAAAVRPDLGDEAADLLRRCRKQLGMRVVGEMFDKDLGFTWGTKGYWRTLEAAVALRMLPLIHCGNEHLAELGGSLPAGKFLVAHFMRSIETRVEVMLRYPNLYLVISGSDIARAGELTWAVRTLGADRVVFGSDLGATDPVIAVQCVRRSGLTEQEQAQVFAGTFRTLWQWTEG